MWGQWPPLVRLGAEPYWLDNPKPLRYFCYPPCLDAKVNFFRFFFPGHPHAFGAFSPRGLRILRNSRHIGKLVIVDLESYLRLLLTSSFTSSPFFDAQALDCYPQRKALHALKASARRISFEASRIPVTQATPGQVGWTLWHHSYEYTPGPGLCLYNNAELLRPSEVNSKTRLGAGSGTKRKTPGGLTQPVAVSAFRWPVSSIQTEACCAHGHSNNLVISTMTSTPQSNFSCGMTEPPCPSR